jgi:hypothetical protein
MIRLSNHRPPDALGPLALRLRLALFFGALPLVAWWFDWQNLIGPASGPPFTVAAAATAPSGL